MVGFGHFSIVFKGMWWKGHTSRRWYLISKGGWYGGLLGTISAAEFIQYKPSVRCLLEIVECDEVDEIMISWLSL